MEICRLCNTSRPQKELINFNDRTREITKRLRETFSIELVISQNPVHNLCCRICIKKLESSHSFYQQVVESQKSFEAANYDPLNTVIIKTEAEEDLGEDYGEYDETYDDGDFDEGDEGGTSTSLMKNEQSESESQKSWKIPTGRHTPRAAKKRKFDRYSAFGRAVEDFTKTIEFSVSEIENCSIIEEGSIKFLQKRHDNVEGKTPYHKVLCAKLKQASPVNSEFKVIDGFKNSGKKNKVCYVLCEHRRKMPVSHVAFEHQFGSPLSLKWKVDCEKCAGIDKTDKAETKLKSQENVEPKCTISFEPAPSENVEFRRAMKILAGSLNTVLLGIEHKCLADPNPLDVLFNNIAEFGIIANSAVVDTIFALQRTIN